ncbi:MAG TPA: serine/threonine-protein kinase, partial [Urbifossiella sp.]
MTRPGSIEDVLELIRRSGVVADDRLNAFIQMLEESRAASVQTAALSTSIPTPADVLNLMVERGLLTSFQSRELAAGRSEFSIGGYRILDLLGRGGMGQVYLAEHSLLGKRVALKVLSTADRAVDSASEPFTREARAAAALDHPNIVRVFDVNVVHNPPYLVMEYIDGVSLQAAVARHGTFTAGEAAAVGVEVAMGLQRASELGLVHRDIKPANILIDRKGGVKILDLGIARFNTDPISRLADTQTVIGTLDYLAPEQAIDSSLVDSRADQYSLGGTLFFLLAGHPPFADDEMQRKLVRKQQSNPPSLAALRLDIPCGLAEVINRMLSRSASDRYATPQDSARALKPWAARGPEFPERFFRPWRSPTDAPGPPTSSGNDPSPTPLPPTRVILRAQTERRIMPPEAMPDTTPMPMAFNSDTLAEALETADPVSVSDSEAVIDVLLDESGSPTETLRAAPIR